MMIRSISRLVLLLLVISLIANAVPAQVTTSGRLSGVVKDAQGALVPNAQIVAKNDQTQGEYKTTANGEGEWTIPSIPNGVYTVTIAAQGFKTGVAKEVKVDAGQAASLNVTLEVGGATEQVVITSGAEVLQKESATVATTITGKQIGELPWATRDALQLVLTLPGVVTPDKPRTSSVNGLPKGSINLTLDGANIQDNFLRSSDGFFTSIQAKSDAVQEVTVSTAAPGAESGGEGAVQIRFVTKSGSSSYHGGMFWQYRSKTFNSNYYFNNIDGLPRDAFILRQYGGNIGGPILIPKLLKDKEKALFFVNYEYFTLPNAYASTAVIGNSLLLTPAAQNGIFTYLDSTNTVRQVNLYQIAAAKNPSLPSSVRPYASTPDPTVLAGLNLISDAVKREGTITSRIASAGDYNRLDYNYQDPGKNIRWFPTARLDFNLTSKHHVEFIHNYQHYFSTPDGVNGQINVYPGTGIVVGHPGTEGSIHRNTFSFVAAHRWTITDRLINELRATSSGNGTSLFTQEFAPGLFDFWGGYAVQTSTYLGPQGFGGGAFYTRRSQSRRNTPVKGLSDNLTWLQGSHTLNFGFAFTRIASFTQAVDTQVVPQITFGIDAADPINNGSTSIFTTTNFPGSTTTQRSQAGSLYALLTGRMTAVNRTVSLDETSRGYGFIPFTERNHQNEFAFYGQDSYKLKPNLTLNYGLRWEIDPSPVNDNNIYSRTGIDGIFGISGDGNLFKPSVLTGKPTAFRLLNDGEQGFETKFKQFAPSFGFAYSPNFKSGILNKLFGDGDKTVLRGGYSIAFTREGFNAYTSIFGANDGGTLTLNVNPSTTPDIFPSGGIYFRDKVYPARTPPADTSRFPFVPGFLSGTSSNDFDPNIRPGYTQSWTFGLQREIDKNTAVEIRYVGNHGTHLWRQINYNEVNIFENGFLDLFKVAQNNLAIFTAANPGCVAAGNCNYGNAGLTGQAAVPLLTTAYGSNTNLTVQTFLQQGQAGALANNIATSATRMNNLMNANLIPFVTLPNGQKASNFFLLNPQTSGGAFVMTNGIDTRFDALQLEFRRRLANGLLIQASYQFAKAFSNSYSSSAVVASDPRTLRNNKLDRTFSPWDIRHAFKADWIYELPFGPGKKFANSNNPVLSRVVGGWQLGGVARIQSGTTLLLTSGRATFNNKEAGVELRNISREQLQDLVKIRKTTVCDPLCHGVVYWLPSDIINNTLAAFEVGGKTLKDLNAAAPYVGPPTTPGKLGQRILLYGPMTTRFDLNMVKTIRIRETMSFEGRVQMLNAFNNQNFIIGGEAESVNSPLHTVSAGSSFFGQNRSAYRDPTVSGTNDPGGRIIEFQLRFKF